MCITGEPTLPQPGSEALSSLYVEIIKREITMGWQFGIWQDIFSTNYPITGGYMVLGLENAVG